MGCACCRHREDPTSRSAPTHDEDEDMMGINPKRPLYDEKGRALDRRTLRLLKRTPSDDLTQLFKGEPY